MTGVTRSRAANMTTDTGPEGLVSSVPKARSTAPAPARVVASALAGSLSGLAASGADAVFVRSTQGGDVSLLSLVAADVGIVAPFALVIGAGVGALVAVVAGAATSPAKLLEVLDAGDANERARKSAGMLSGAAFAVAAFVALAHVAKAILAADQPPRVSGAVLAAVAALFAVGVGSGATVAASVAGARADAWLGSPRRALGVAVLAVLVLGAAGIASGDTNGGGGPLGILGVLKREELDLRGVGLVAGIAVGAFAGADLALRLSVRHSLVVAALPLLATIYAAGWGLERRESAIAVERGAPLASKALTLLRRLTDRDHDGASARFGGGDCNDRNPHVFPGADDVPGNGVDEDCSGADERAVPAEPARTPVATSGNWVKEHFPTGLSVVLVTVDTLRADLGYAGNPRPVSPAIDALARNSVVFDHAYSLASYTGKSVGPMLLGKYPSETSRTFDHFDKFGTDETFVQERLRRSGIRTLTAQGHWYFRADTGIGRGFDEGDYSAAPKVPQMEGDRTVNGDKLTDAAIGLLEKPENVARPFFLWVHYVDPHAAYVPHAEFDFGSRGRDLYDSEVAFVDHHLGRLLSLLSKPPFAEHTAVLLTSDHGEAFGEHGLYRHGFEVWEELVHVPLIVHVPGVAPRHVAVRRSAIDLVPTLLELFGVPVPHPEGNDFVSGVSLLPDVVRSREASDESRAVLVDMSEGPNNAERQAFFDGSYKVIASNGRPMALYDLNQDPGEKTDLLGKGPEADAVVAAFRAFRRRLRTRPAKR